MKTTITKAREIYLATLTDCMKYMHEERFTGFNKVITDKEVCTRTLNAILKECDKEEEKAAINIRLGVKGWTSERVAAIQLVRNTVAKHRALLAEQKAKLEASIAKMIEYTRAMNEADKAACEAAEAEQIEEVEEETAAPEAEAVQTVPMEIVDEIMKTCDCGACTKERGCPYHYICYGIDNDTPEFEQAIMRRYSELTA